MRANADISSKYWQTEILGHEAHEMHNDEKALKFSRSLRVKQGVCEDFDVFYFFPPKFSQLSHSGKFHCEYCDRTFSPCLVKGEGLPEFLIDEAAAAAS